MGLHSWPNDSTSKHMSEMALVRPKKRIFLGLALTGLAVSAVGMAGIWRLVAPGLSQISGYLPYVFGAVLFAAIVVWALGLFLIILALLGVPIVAFAQRLAWWAVNFAFPIATLLGKLFDIRRELIERSFIEVSNHLVRRKQLSVAAGKVLILAPHCLQLDTCSHRITRKVDNCKRCGKCPIGDLLGVAERTGVHLAVVPGGTLARQVIKSLRPRAVLAIACERDLVSGIQDVFPLPVVGILNERPYGPCCNTKVDAAKVEQTLEGFLQKTS